MGRNEAEGALPQGLEEEAQWQMGFCMEALT